MIRDVDLARKRLMAAGVTGIGEATQFRDIGYLTHLTDHAGSQVAPTSSRDRKPSCSGTLTTFHTSQATQVALAPTSIGDRGDHLVPGHWLPYTSCRPRR